MKRGLIIETPESKKSRIREKVLSEEKKDLKELAFWRKQQARPKKNGYLWYLMLILTLVYIVDEIATNLNSTMQPYMLKEFFVVGQGLSDSDAQSVWQGWSLFGLACSLLVILYRPLADRFGRKAFLVINTVFMAVGMTLCFASPVFPVYLLGYVFLTFMTGPDMQVVYIMECAPEKYRATFVSVIKGVSQLGIALIALGMDVFMKNNDGAWRQVFLIPAIIGFAVSFIALLCARETDQFLNERISYLSLSSEEKIALLCDKTKKNEKAQGGALPAIKFGFRHHQLKWLFIASMLYTLAFQGTAYYGQIIHNAGFSGEQLQEVALVWPFVSAFITIVYGLFSDRFGRKVVSISLGSLVIIGLTFMSLGLLYGWNAYAVGAFLGLFLAGYWNWGDTFVLMVSESAPTNFRSSAAGDQNLFAAAGYLVGYLVIILFTNLAPGQLAYLDFVYLALAIPGVVAALLIVAFKIGETKGLDLDKVRGDEWDKKPLER